MRQVDLTTMMNCAYASKAKLEEEASYNGRPVRLYLHWTACGYWNKFNDYHINIDGDGKIFFSTDDFAERLAHTYMRNSGAVGIALCCCDNSSTPNGFGNCPPTIAQVDTMEQVIAVLTKALNIPIDIRHVMTHAEIADAQGDDEGYSDGLYGPIYGDYNKWDLLSCEADYPAINIKSYDDPHNGGNIIRAKAKEYRMKFYGD